jgi:hypothetical protein
LDQILPLLVGLFDDLDGEVRLSHAALERKL